MARFLRWFYEPAILVPRAFIFVYYLFFLGIMLLVLMIYFQRVAT